MSPDLEQLGALLTRIRALCENPHWSSDRRWRVNELAARAQTHLERLVIEEKIRAQTPAPVDSRDLR